VNLKLISLLLNFLTSFVARSLLDKFLSHSFTHILSYLCDIVFIVYKGYYVIIILSLIFMFFIACPCNV